ncbi:ATPase inhibitor subunit zeta [Salinarimonas rosea]|uniref:ATPase inhibitor subunit zeta n=1 Tax=Salinarimonas rosea TaxID=552063 RepID=UPI000A056E08|nr:ATPase inhibitor subunit zeta [Salinarimonas rosea]
MPVDLPSMIPPASSATSWCTDDGTRDNVVARSNVLVTLWAGRLMGLSGSDLTAYSAKVHMSDLEVPGDEDVVRKIVEDLRLSGMPERSGEVRERLNRAHREALQQTHVTD